MCVEILLCSYVKEIQWGCLFSRHLISEVGNSNRTWIPTRKNVPFWDATKRGGPTFAKALLSRLRLVERGMEGDASSKDMMLQQS